MLEEGSFSSEEVYHVRRDGSVFPTLMNGVVIPDAEGNSIFMAATALDITDRKKAEAILTDAMDRLEKSHSDLLSILNELSLGTAIFDENDCITFLSRAAERLTGLNQTDVLREPWEKALPLDKQHRKQLGEMISRDASERSRISVDWDDDQGRRYWLEIEVKDDPRDPKKKILFLYDTSELHDLRQLLDQKVKYQDLIGKSKQMQQVFEQIQQLCKVDTTVLVEGETGTGKELVARALHFASLRKDKPFIAVNCSGLTESVLHSQLFGHKRGSFTGAVQDHRGVFEDADKGTVFLDEIAGISPSVQASLLRVLDEKEITPLGESIPKKVDVRIIAASNQNLGQEVEEGRFRADLLYRIRVARVQLSPLSQRREDIPLLAQEFLRQSRATTGKPVEEISAEAMKLLMEYSWPGNVRELRNAIEYAALQCRHKSIHATDFPPEILEPRTLPALSAQDSMTERERLLYALERARGNRSEAARLLGISRATFYRRLVNNQIDLNS
jgi:PAS domain S-box-containing protein